MIFIQHLNFENNPPLGKKYSITRATLTTIAIAILLLAYSCDNEPSTAENDINDDDRKLFKSEKIGFFTEQMNLTEEEAKIFWPIYNEFDSKRDSLWRARRHFMFAYYNNHEGMDSRQHQEALEEFLFFENKECRLRNNLAERLKNHLPPEKILIMFYTETQFKHFILNKIRGRHHRRGRGIGIGRGQNRPEPPCTKEPNKQIIEP